MKDTIRTIAFTASEPGVVKKDDGFVFTFDPGDVRDRECGVILYGPGETIKRIPFPEGCRFGNLLSMKITGINPGIFSYRFYIDNETVNDPYAPACTGFKGFGKAVPEESIRALLKTGDFDWGKDESPQTPYEDSILYGLNVRAFTMHRSSGVSKKGTYEGIAEKIPYLKELGVTGIVLMPTYEFDECSAMRLRKKPRDQEEAKTFSNDTEVTEKVNCWGFVGGSYFAPKASYAASSDPTVSFKTMVRELHKAGLEVIMQFYFPADTMQLMILRAIKHWVSEYHVDGFRISGFQVPYRLLIEDPYLKRTKLWFTNIPYDELSTVSEHPSFRNLASDNGNFRYDMRRFLKADEGMLSAYLNYQKCNPSRHAVINYISDYDGFTLFDLYAYERKHNEANGEQNRDGNDINFSWNCGTEGPSRKKSINQQRIRQIKNAITILMLSSGTPYLFSGDEFLNSRGGNNNAYCQDNDTGYVKWKDTDMSREILAFTKEMIRFRKEHRILHMPEELKVLDTKGEGYPDLSYHGYEAWRPDLSFISRMIGMFFYGPYSGEKDAPSVYIGVNMHWENHRLALPKFKNGLKYEKKIDTGNGTGTAKENEIPVGERSIVVYEAIPMKDMSGKRSRTGKKK
ncbi:MAG: hypothetical protein K6F53_07610 [Lachnospiraceae bacterium]|nr:hypothetical protein [Lachnospiraceae bacterium]